MLARHLPCFGSELKLLHTDSAVRLRSDVADRDLDRWHRLHGGLRRRRMLAPPDAVYLDLRQLIQKPIESRSHQDLRHARRQRAETRSCTVIIIQLETPFLAASISFATVSRSSENNEQENERRNKMTQRVGSNPGQVGSSVTWFSKAQKQIYLSF